MKVIKKLSNKEAKEIVSDKTRILKARMLQGDLNLFKSLQNKVFSENL